MDIRLLLLIVLGITAIIGLPIFIIGLVIERQLRLVYKQLRSMVDAEYIGED